MMTDTAVQLSARLKELKAQRKEGGLPLKAYYRELLEMVGRLAESLGQEVESLSEEEILLQTPLVLLFIEEQIRKFGERS